MKDYKICDYIGIKQLVSWIKPGTTFYCYVRAVQSLYSTLVVTAA